MKHTTQAETRFNHTLKWDLQTKPVCILQKCYSITGTRTTTQHRTQYTYIHTPWAHPEKIKKGKDER